MHIIFFINSWFATAIYKKDNNKKNMLIRSPKIVKPHITVFFLFSWSNYSSWRRCRRRLLGTAGTGLIELLLVRIMEGNVFLNNMRIISCTEHYAASLALSFRSARLPGTGHKGRRGANDGCSGAILRSIFSRRGILLSNKKTH